MGESLASESNRDKANLPRVPAYSSEPPGSLLGASESMTKGLALTLSTRPLVKGYEVVDAD